MYLNFTRFMLFGEWIVCKSIPYMHYKRLDVVVCWFLYVGVKKNKQEQNYTFSMPLPWGRYSLGLKWFLEGVKYHRWRYTQGKSEEIIEKEQNISNVHTKYIYFPFCIGNWNLLLSFSLPCSRHTEAQRNTLWREL